MSKFHIVIDSMSTISDELLKNKAITVIPYTINDIKGNLTKDEFSPQQSDKVLKEIENNNLQKTSFVPGAVLEELFKPMCSKYNTVIYLCATEGYTGQFRSAQTLMSKLKNLWVIDSRSIASTIESLVYEIIEYVDKNKDATYDDIQELAIKVANRSSIVFAPKDLSGMIHSGRAPAILVKIMKMAKAHPLIKCEEKNKPTGVITRKWDEIWDKILDTINKLFDGQLQGNDIKHVYLYNSLIDKLEIKRAKEKIAKFFDIDINKIQIRLTPLPVLVYALRYAVGIGITTTGKIKK